MVLCEQSKTSNSDVMMTEHHSATTTSATSTMLCAQLLAPTFATAVGSARLTTVLTMLLFVGQLLAATTGNCQSRPLVSSM